MLAMDGTSFKTLVPKLRLGMPLRAKLRFARAGCPRAGRTLNQPAEHPRLGNGVSLPSAFPSGAWERGASRASTSASRSSWVRLQSARPSSASLLQGQRPFVLQPRVAATLGYLAQQEPTPTGLRHDPPQGCNGRNPVGVGAHFTVDPGLQQPWAGGRNPFEVERGSSRSTFSKPPRWLPRLA